MKITNEITLNKDEILNAFKNNLPYSSANLIINAFAYPILSFQNLFTGEFITTLKDSLLDLEFFTKSNDLFEFAQSSELSTLNNHGIKEFTQYMSNEFTKTLSDITGISLINKISLAGQIYTKGGYLELHDDDIGDSAIGRKVAFILYLEDLKKEDGGMLEVYDKEFRFSGEVCPEWGKLVCFEVTKESWHRVGEVLSDELRVSITGWIYGEITERNESVRLPCLPSTEYEEFKRERELKWMNKFNAKKISKVFLKESCVELQKFMKTETFTALKQEILKSESIKVGPMNIQSFKKIIPGDKSKSIINDFKSSTFSLWLQQIVSFTPLNISLEIRHFAKGDYTLLTDLPQPSGNTFVHYMSDDECLLSVDSEENKLVMVYREEGVKMFFKRVGAVDEEMIVIFGHVIVDEEDSEESGDEFEGVEEEGGR